ncbi:MAG: DUF1684 domain-containing protein [Actinomycetota bacterium]|nr:DUF1684 domain-containing protein [Actinomycetota bacterium]
MTETDPEYGSLWEYRRRVGDMSQHVRAVGTSEASWNQWRSERDDLFRSHPDSPIPKEQRSGFAGLPFSNYAQAWNVDATLEEFSPSPAGLVNSGDGSTHSLRIGEVVGNSPNGPFSLAAFWMNDYGGGIFIPFRDETNGTGTYGGGRYLLDSAKGADLGTHDGRVVLDFNFAYHPSCVHDSRWSCPLAPQESLLNFAVPVGERLRHSG